LSQKAATLTPTFAGIKSRWETGSFSSCVFCPHSCLSPTIHPPFPPVLPIALLERRHARSRRFSPFLRSRHCLGRFQRRGKRAGWGRTGRRKRGREGPREQGSEERKDHALSLCFFALHQGETAGDGERIDLWGTTEGALCSLEGKRWGKAGGGREGGREQRGKVRWRTKKVWQRGCWLFDFHWMMVSQALPEDSQERLIYLEKAEKLRGRVHVLIICLLILCACSVPRHAQSRKYCIR